MCQDEHENEDEDESFGWFWCFFNIKGDERTSTSSLLRTNKLNSFLIRLFQVFLNKKW